MITLSQSEMLARWLLATRQEVPPADESATSAGLRQLAADEMRRWYVSCLATAPAEMLPVSDLAPRVTVETGDGTGPVTLRLPDEAVRPLSVMLYGWQRPAEVVEAGSPRARMQSNPFSCGGVESPVAVWHRADHRLELYSPPAGAASARLDTLQCVTDPGPTSYIMREDLLGTINEYFRNNCL